MHNVNTYVSTVLYSKWAIGITKYPKFSIATNFYRSQNDFRDLLDFLVVFSDWMSWNVVQTKF